MVHDIYFHVSPEASITKFQGRYSPKFKTKGLFVCPKFSSIADSWAPYVSGKKHPRSTKNRFDDCYKTLTVYKLRVAKSIIKICEDLYNEKYKEARAKVKDGMSILGAWGWDLELFIPHEYLNSIEIIGRETFNDHEFNKLTRPHFEKGEGFSHIKYAKKSLPNYAAKKYIEIENLLLNVLVSLNLEESKFVKLNFDSKNKLKLVDYFVNKGEFGYHWSPTPNRIFSKKEHQLIDSIYENSINQINKLKNLAKNFSPKEMLLNHKFDLTCNKMKSCYYDYPKIYLKLVKDCAGNDCLRCSTCRKIAYVKA